MAAFRGLRHPDVRQGDQERSDRVFDQAVQRDKDLLDAIQLGLARDRAWLENKKAIAALRDRFETPREREVMALVVSGSLNKQIAYDIGISEITVKVRRGQVMR